MKSLRAGAILLSLWSGANLLVASVVTVTTVAGHPTPILALLFPESEIPRLDGRLVAVVNAQAALANPCIVALCLLVLAVVWTSLVARARWALWALGGTLLPLQAFGFVSDAYLGHRHLGANLVSTLVLVAGLALSGYGLGRDLSETRAPAIPPPHPPAH